MQLNFDYDSSTTAAPSGFKSALAYVAAVLDALITNPITVTISIGWNEIAGTALGAGTLAEGGDSPGIHLSYSSLVAALTANAGNMADQQAMASLPAGAAAQLGNSLFVSSAQEKAWGLLPANAAGDDGAVGFSASALFNFNTANQNIPGQVGFVGVAEHEITHAMARLTGDGAFALTDYSAPGILNTSGSGGYYSIDGGVTDLANFAAASQDPSDWASQTGDAFNFQSGAGYGGILTERDQSLLGTLGFSEPNTQFLVANQTTGTSSMQNGTPYSGPVPFVQQEYIYAGSANLAITSYTGSSFIHTGSGNDAIDVSQVGGLNVLDGSTGSNFLTGGSGLDTFFVDDRNASSAIWSTIRGFHSGDTATIWGVTQAGFTIDWLDGQGAAGSTGLTGGFAAAGQPDANVTIAGYTTADMAPGGRLTITYGTTPNLPGLPGSAYMSIHAT